MEKREILNLVKEFESEFSKIYYEVSDYDEISVYKKTLLSNKAYLLALKYKDFVTQIIDEDKKITEKIKNKYKLLIVTVIVTLTIVFFFPMLSLLPFIFELYILKSIKKLKSEALTKKDIEDIESIATDINCIVNNIHTFLEGKSNKRIERLQQERKNNLEDTLKINIANSWLEIVLGTDFDDKNILNTLPKEIEEIIVKMLQEDLDTLETDLLTLISMAKHKIKENSVVLDDDLKLSRFKS